MSTRRRVTPAERTTVTDKANVKRPTGDAGLLVATVVGVLFFLVTLVGFWLTGTLISKAAAQTVLEWGLPLSVLMGLGAHAWVTIRGGLR
ncbi:hypothetical protein ACFQ1S_02065 [Kibdelosporangium lantanae]|uniref:Cell division protein CrgA n=1 Tax=Kibdelosporangium lantanae TaxID=1497396 RepID=A0ABW3M189_9PSEU